MQENVMIAWSKSNPQLSLPASGLLEETAGDVRRGAIGFRAGGEGCEIWHETQADWPTLVARITTQARKSKYHSAVF